MSEVRFVGAFYDNAPRLHATRAQHAMLQHALHAGLVFAMRKAQRMNHESLPHASYTTFARSCSPKEMV